MKAINGGDLVDVIELVGKLRRLPAIAYLRGAEAALAGDRPEPDTALTLLRQALAILDPKSEPRR